MSADFIALATGGVASLQPYRPGKPASELERELGVKDIVKLASNENPLGPSPVALAAARDALAEMHLYPDGSGYRLKRALSTRYGIDPECITLGNGSNELLNMIARVFLHPDDEVIYSEYSFIAYAMAVKACNAQARIVPARDYAHDLAAMAAAVTPRTRIIFLANPNNPTGTAFTGPELVAFLDAVPEQVVVVLDEAYTEYVDPAQGLANGLALRTRYPNLVVLRTFSKAFGLAGLRVGFAVADRVITDLMNRVREPFNVNVPALAAAEAVLGDEAYLRRSIEVNAAGMSQLCAGLTALGLEYIPSFGNFVTVDMARPTAPIYQALLREGVILRPLDNYAMPHHLRISVGLEAENRRCLEALARVLAC